MDKMHQKLPDGEIEKINKKKRKPTEPEQPQIHIDTPDMPDHDPEERRRWEEEERKKKDSPGGVEKIDLL